MFHKVFLSITQLFSSPVLPFFFFKTCCWRLIKKECEFFIEQYIFSVPTSCSVFFALFSMKHEFTGFWKSSDCVFIRIFNSVPPVFNWGGSFLELSCGNGVPVVTKLNLCLDWLTCRIKYDITLMVKMYLCQ